MCGDQNQSHLALVTLGWERSFRQVWSSSWFGPGASWRTRARSGRSQRFAQKAALRPRVPLVCQVLCPRAGINPTISVQPIGAVAMFA